MPNPSQVDAAKVESILSHVLDPIPNELITFFNSDGTVDSGTAAGIVVYGNIKNAPIVGIIGNIVGDKSGDPLASSIVFTSGVMDSTKEVQFDHTPTPTNRLANMATVLAALSGNGWWTCDYESGAIVVKKATAGTSQLISSYKVRTQRTGGSSSTGSSTSTGIGAGSLSTGGGDHMYSNTTGDFTATANSGAKTITLSAYASTLLSSTITVRNFLNASIKRISSAGVADILPLTTMTFAANVLTLTNMTVNFASGDTVAVFVPGPDKAYDETNDLQKTTLTSLIHGEDETFDVLMVQDKPIISALYVWSEFQNLGANTKLNMRAVASNINSISATNANATVRYLQIFKTATTPAGGAVPNWTIAIPPANGGTPGSAGWNQVDWGKGGLNSTVGWAYGISTTPTTFTDSATSSDHIIQATIK